MTTTATSKQTNRLAAGLIATLVVVAGFWAFGRGSADGSAAPGGDPAPEVSFQYFSGEQGTLADFAGTPVVLNFWASWCPACVAEMPDFQAVHEALGDEVVFLGMDMQDVSRAAALGLVESTGVEYLLADDPTGEVFAAFGGFAMPTTVFINAAGEVVETHSGTIFADDLTAKINELLLSG